MAHSQHHEHIEFPPSELMLNPDGSVYHLNLLPEHIADTILTVGDPSRVYQISRHFDTLEFEMIKREFHTHTGTYKGKRLSVISTGMGTDNIEIFMNEVDALVNIDLRHRHRKAQHTRLKIIRIGTSGSLQEDVPLGSHLVSDYAVGLDTLMFFYKLPTDTFEKQLASAVQQHIGLPFTPYCVKGSDILKEQLASNMLEGITITCPGFYAPQGRKLRFELQYPDFVAKMASFTYADIRLTNFEMETAGYYALGRLLGHEVLSLNAIIAHRPSGQFAEHPKKIVDALIEKVLSRIVC
ncbi:MAG: nucleoside phosphorylase [Flammeovirgaceae bacterium]|nr:nucleoside phosphorylase [Flammeovirgaceae bacterium]MDW8286752.1 nucleoside phosphorylase [Flammeovirgaceae bacterium]